MGKRRGKLLVDRMEDRALWDHVDRQVQWLLRAAEMHEPPGALLPRLRLVEQAFGELRLRGRQLEFEPYLGKSE